MWLGEALGHNGDGHLAAMEHEAGIEQVTGHRLGSGRGWDLGVSSDLGINTHPVSSETVRRVLRLFLLHHSLE